MIMQVKKARQAQASEYETFGNSHGHEISADQIIEIIKKMAKPNHVGYQGETGRLFEIVHYGKKDKRFDVSVFFDLNAYKDSRYLQKYKSENMHYDIAVTLIPMNKQEIKRLISNINNTVFTPNYKKGVPQLTIGQPVPSVLNDTPFYENTITDSDGKSNPSTQKNSDRFTDTDRDYLSAVERGDMETAQRMVDEAAEREMAAIVSRGFESARENEREFGKAQSAERFSKVGETEYTKYNSFIDKKDIKFKIHN